MEDHSPTPQAKQRAANRRRHQRTPNNRDTQRDAQPMPQNTTIPYLHHTKDAEIACLRAQVANLQTQVHHLAYERGALRSNYYNLVGHVGSTVRFLDENGMSDVVRKFLFEGLTGDNVGSIHWAVVGDGRRWRFGGGPGV
ncbi:Chitin synthase B [Venturia inaequalis]|uniref:Uncharacterized protein n=1 Tax=Venturia inaequalis TaxID=5025 RepID=A0A8H3V8F2_VENIN|nr:hypothetical protein EG327_005567 [Venturia inaequalis]RDI89630.1 Chitin synthase B [Venturia inaequalis]